MTIIATIHLWTALAAAFFTGVLTALLTSWTARVMRGQR